VLDLVIDEIANASPSLNDKGPRSETP
jgi:hypothetical protein